MNISIVAIRIPARRVCTSLQIIHRSYLHIGAAVSIEGKHMCCLMINSVGLVGEVAGSVGIVGSGVCLANVAQAVAGSSGTTFQHGAAFEHIRTVVAGGHFVGFPL